MNIDQKPVIWTVVVGFLIIIALGAWAVGNVKDSIPEVPDFPEINIPTASDIASQIVIPEVDIPRFNYGNYDDLLQGVYPNLVGYLEADCINSLIAEFGFPDDNDSESYDDIKDLIEDHEGDDIVQFTVTNLNWDNDYDFTVQDLGLHDDETRRARITSTLRVRYVLEDGVENETILDKVYSVATCSNWDDDDNEFDDLTVRYTL